MQPLRKTPGALPFFIAAFLNAFVDLGHKIVIQNTVYKLYDGPEQVVLTAIVNALILLPFLLLLSPAGFVSDKFYKSHVMRMSGWAVVILTIAITGCYYMGWFKAAFAMTFLLAAQSAIYSPAKYGYIKELFGMERLGEANGIVSALSICAILAGSFAYTIAFEVFYPTHATQEAEVLRAIAPVGWLLIINAVIELVMMYRLPKTGCPNIQLQFDRSAFFSGRLIVRDLQPLKHNKTILLSVLGLAMFWSIGQVLLAAFPSFLKATTGELNTLKVQGVLACSGLGIAIGSILAGKVSRNYIELGLLPFGALGILLGLSVLTYLDHLIAYALCFLIIGISGGLFIIPLNALVQFNAPNNALGKTLAANNWVQNLAMLSFLIVTALFASLQLSSELLLKLMAIVALMGCLYTLKQLPQAFVRFALASVISRRYRVNVQGMRHIPATGGVLLLGNHISWIDWAILQLACPRPVRFVMIKHIYQRWYLKRFLDLMGCIPIEQGASAQSSLERVAKYLNQGDVVCLFPEGTISRTGHLAEFRKGFERAAALCNNDVVIIPFYLRGLWGSQFSRASEHFKTIKKCKLTRQLLCAFGNSLPLTITSETLKRRVYDLSMVAWQAQLNDEPTIGEAWIEKAKQVGNNALILDPSHQHLTGHQALAASIIWARRLRLHKTHHIGVMLPPSKEAAILHMAAFMAGISIVNIDPHQEIALIHDRLKALNIEHIYGFKTLPIQLSNEFALVDMNKLKSHSLEQWLTHIYVRFTPAWKIKWLSLCVSQCAKSAITVLTPTHSITLSQKNIQANILQIADVLNANEDDVVLAQQPLHQAYGLTVGLLMPLLQGIAVVPQPIDNSVASARAIAQHDVSLLFANNDTLDNLTHHKKIHPLMLDSLRAVVCSYLSPSTDGQLHPLQNQVRTQFQLKFNHSVLVGFGLSEASPVISCNIPDAIDTHNWRVQIGEKPQTQGMPLPGTSLRIVDDKNQEQPCNTPGTLWVAGPQIMTGYIDDESPFEEVDGIKWLKTPFKGVLDEDGFLILAE